MSQTASYGKWTQTNARKAYGMARMGLEDTVGGCAEDK